MRKKNDNEDKDEKISIAAGKIRQTVKAAETRKKNNKKKYIKETAERKEEINSFIKDFRAKIENDRRQEILKYIKDLEEIKKEDPYILLDNESKKYSKKPKDKIIAAYLFKNYGILSKTARDLNISTTSLKRYIEDNVKLKEVLEIAQDTVVDVAEEGLTVLLENLDKEAIFFTLKSAKGRKRGYGQGADTNISVSSGTIVNFLPEKEEYETGPEEESEKEL